MQFSAEDQLFLDGLFKRFPHVAEGFKTFAAIAPEHRLAAAQHAVRHLRRQGYIYCGLPEDETETVQEHMDDLAEMAMLFVKDEETARRIANVALIHDLGEALIGDFIPMDRISKQEKHRLEALAANIVFAHDPDNLHQTYSKFGNSSDPAYRLAGDLDKVQFAKGCLCVQLEYPEFASSTTEIFSNVSNLIRTEEGGQIMALLDNLKHLADEGALSSALANPQAMTEHMAYCLGMDTTLMAERLAAMPAPIKTPGRKAREYASLLHP